MRLGELLGLKWGDIDFDESQLHVGRTISKEAFPGTRQHPGDSKHLYPHSPRHRTEPNGTAGGRGELLNKKSR